jgi:mannosyltransferase OCH1-like enzyme
MIPKKIHYCWFGNKKMPKTAKKCIESWKRYCPDYEIICWNERNFNIHSNKYVNEAYKNGKYAFVTDFVRLFVLYNYGGIYMDTDVEVIKKIDKFLYNDAFSGFEGNNTVPTGIMASKAGLDIYKELLSYYNDRNFVKEDGTLDLTSNVTTITKILSKKGLKLDNTLQTVEKFTVYPKDYFCPIDYATKAKNITENTCTIHWFAGSWVSRKQKIKMFTYRVLSKIFKEDIKKISKVIKNNKRN